MTRRLALLLAAGLALAATAEERLVLPTPDAWTRVDGVESPSLRRAVFAVPVDEETVDRLSVEWFASELAPGTDPLAVTELLADGLRRSCLRAEDQPVHAGLENGYPVVVRLMSCARRRGGEEGEILMVKAIQGNTGLWTVVRARAVPAFDEAEEVPLEEAVVAEWSRTLRDVLLCDDTASDAHPCPAESVEEG
jgi:hypothetical protein